jgi:hypothetical protein
MNPLRPRFLLPLLLLASAAAGAFKPSTVEGQVVRNATIGYHGFRITFPDGYQHSVVATDRKNSTPGYGQTAWRMASDYDRIAAGVTTREIVVFEKQNRMAIALAVASMVQEHANSDFTRFELVAEMKHEADTLKFDTGQVLLRTVDDSGKQPCAKVVRTFTQGAHTYVNAIYTVNGRLKERYVLNGVCFIRDKDTLLADMDALMASLDTEKPKKKKS